MHDVKPHKSPESGAERRIHPRAKAEWPLTVALPEGYFEARLRDVSAAGVCFHIDRPVAEMSVLALQLDLPLGDETRRIRGEGAVVRCMRVSPALEHYEVAVFFHSLDDDDRAALEAYVSAT